VSRLSGPRRNKATTIARDVHGIAFVPWFSVPPPLHPRRTHARARANVNTIRSGRASALPRDLLRQTLPPPPPVTLTNSFVRTHARTADAIIKRVTASATRQLQHRHDRFSFFSVRGQPATICFRASESRTYTNNTYA